MKKIHEKVVFYLDKVLIGKYEKWSLFATAFLDSIIGILPTDFIVIYYFIRHEKARIFFQAVLVAFGSVLGASILYFLSHDILNFFPSILESDYYKKTLDLINYSIWIQLGIIIFFAFSSTIPFTWLSVLLGVLKIPFLIVFLPAMFLGRFLRFILINILSKKYGKKSLKIIQKYIWELLVFILIVVIIYFIYHFIK